MATSCSVSISGTSTGATCVSFSNCELACCTKTPTGCGGEVSHLCSYPLSEACGDNPCCYWSSLPVPAHCTKKSCSGLSEENCAACGCTPSGTCIKIACGSLTGASKNPDVCAGCSTCGGDWDIDNDRGLTPWAITVTGELHVNTGGHIVVSGYRLNAGSIRTKAHAVHVRPGTGGNIHVT